MLCGDAIKDDTFLKDISQTLTSNDFVRDVQGWMASVKTADEKDGEHHAKLHGPAALLKRRLNGLFKKVQQGMLVTLCDVVSKYHALFLVPVDKFDPKKVKDAQEQLCKYIEHCQKFAHLFRAQSQEISALLNFEGEQR